MMSAKSVAMLMMAMIVIMGMENILVQANRPLCELSGGCELSPSPEDTPISPSPSEDLFGVTPDESPLTLQDFHLTEEDSLSSEDENPFDVNPDCRKKKKKKKKKHHRHSPASAPAPSPSEDLSGDVSPLTLQDFHLTEEDSLSSEDENPFDVNPDCRKKKKKKKKKHHRHSPASAPAPSPSEDLSGDVSPLTLQDFHLTEEDSLSSEDENPFDVNPDCRKKKKKKKKKHHRHSPASAPAPSPSEDLSGDVSPLTLQDFHLTEEDSLSSEDENPFDVNPDCRKKKKKKKKHHRHSPAPAQAPSPSEDLLGDVSPLTLQDFHLTEEDSLSLEDENPFDVNPDCRKKKKKKKKKHHRHSPAPAPSRFDFSINSMSSSPKSPKSPETPKSESWKSEGNTFFCMFGCSMRQCFHLGKDPKDVDRFDSCVVNCLETCNKKK